MCVCVCVCVCVCARARACVCGCVCVWDIVDYLRDEQITELKNAKIILITTISNKVFYNTTISNKIFYKLCGLIVVFNLNLLFMIIFRIRFLEEYDFWQSLSFDFSKSEKGREFLSFHPFSYRWYAVYVIQACYLS